MIAKVIVRSDARAAALERMARVLNGAWIEGVDTNIPLHRQILAHPDFIAGGVDTNFLTNLLGRAALASKPTVVGKDGSHGVD